MFTIWKELKFASLIIQVAGLTFVEYSFSSADSSKPVENCVTESQNCSPVDGRVICYRLCSNNRLPWNDAQSMCANHNSTLPVIRNKKEQEYLETYLKSHTGNSDAVWTSGRKVTHGQWTWLDGQSLRAQVSWEDGSTNSDSKTHALLIKDNILKREKPLNPSWYMCQYRGNSCDTKATLNLTNSCVVLSVNDASWYGARSACLDGGGDLAVLSDEDLKILEDHPAAFIDEITGRTKQYWIGLEKISWQWKLLNKIEQEDVKYSKWSRSDFPLDANLCIFVQTFNGEWRASKCDDNYSVICQSERNTSTSATPVYLSSTVAPSVPSSTSVSTTSTLGPGASLSSTNNPAESTDATTISDPPDDNPAAGSFRTHVVYALIGVGVLLIFICVIIIFLLIRRRQKGVKEIRRSKANTIPSNNGSDPEEEPTKKTPETTTASAYELQGIYAEISPPQNSNKDPKNYNHHPPSGTVYASLEFKKDTTYEEPIIKSNAVNVGPFGDIHAVPTPKDPSAKKGENLINGKIYENF